MGEGVKADRKTTRLSSSRCVSLAILLCNTVVLQTLTFLSSQTALLEAVNLVLSIKLSVSSACRPRQEIQLWSSEREKNVLP